MSVDASIGSSVDLFGLNVGDLQDSVVVGTNAITGTLKYVTGYTGFSSDVSLQDGNFIAIHAAADVSGATITVTVTNPVTLDADGIAVLRIADKDSQTIRVVASKDGYTSAAQTFSLTGLVCETS